MATIKRYRGGTAYDIAYSYEERQDFAPDINKVLLNFDESATKDECGNTWTVGGSPSLSTDTKVFGNSSLYLDGSSYMYLDDIILGGEDFTVDSLFYADSRTSTSGYIYSNTQDNLGINRSANNGYLHFGFLGDDCYVTQVSFNTWHHVANVYEHSKTKRSSYLDGVLKATNSDKAIDPFTTRITIGARTGYNDYRGIGYLQFFRISKGIARWTENFTPPSAPYNNNDSADVDKNIILRHEGANRYIPMTTDLSKTNKPCLALRHEGTNYYAIK